MRIAITGATGFVGRYLVRQLAAAGHQLRCWYRMGSDRSGFDGLPGSIDWLSGQLDDRSATTELVRDADAVVHAAVEWEGPRNRGRGSHGGSDVFLGVNLTGSLHLFQAAFEANVPRFIFVSTCAVHDVILNDRPLDETHPLWAHSHYGAHKAALEAFVHSYGFGQNWPICALRPTGVYGLAHPPQASRWFDLVGQVLRGEPIAMRERRQGSPRCGCGSCRRVALARRRQRPSPDSRSIATTSTWPKNRWPGSPRS